VQVFGEFGGQTRVVWIADLMPHEAANACWSHDGARMEVMKKTLDALNLSR